MSHFLTGSYSGQGSGAARLDHHEGDDIPHSASRPPHDRRGRPPSGVESRGRWTFTEREIARVQGERDRRALRLSLTSTRPQKRTTRRRRSSSGSGSGRLTRADMQAMEHLDRLLADERRLEQTYSLPFRAPQRVATTVHACTRCGQDLLLLIFGDQARDEEG